MLRSIILSFVILLYSTTAFAGETVGITYSLAKAAADRTATLQKEVQELKIRLKKAEEKIEILIKKLEKK